VLPAPAVHADLAALASLALAQKDAPARDVEVAFGERERLADAEPGPPQQHDQGAGPQAVRFVAGASHDGDDSPRRTADRRGSAGPCCGAGDRGAGRAGWRASVGAGGVEHDE
jgi:hypothetical protein